MSGPKVVRIVTREERLATCNTLLAQLDAALGTLRADAARLRDADAEELASATQRWEALSKLVREDRFDAAERQINQEIAFIVANRNELIERAASSAAKARTRASGQRYAAATLAKELERRASGQHAELVTSLRRLAKQTQPSNTADELLAKAMSALASNTPRKELSDAQKALALSLQVPGDHSDSKLRNWVVPQESDKRIEDLQRRLSRIEVLAGTDAADAFSSRLLQLELEPEGQGRDLKLDALVLDVAAQVHALERDSEILAKARGLLAEIDALTDAPELAPVRFRLSEALQKRDIASIDALIDATVIALTTARARAVAAARRKAILSGLASLGYEVNDGMSTSWVENGRIVLRKSDADQHGVEIASAPDAQRLQLRTVAFSMTRAPSSDLAAETTWCGDFAKLRERLRQDSGQLEIEMAKPVGAVPLKVVQSPTTNQVHRHGFSARRKDQSC